MNRDPIRDVEFQVALKYKGQDQLEQVHCDAACGRGEVSRPAIRCRNCATAYSGYHVTHEV